jgi:MFS transporter, NNP family, nitrate/nitrite transporter
MSLPSSPTDGKLNLLNFKAPSVKTLHFSWFAFFLTFVLWFSHAPFKSDIVKAFHMSDAQWKALLILNVALTIPSRIIIGILVDKFGPRVTYSILLASAGVLCTFFALAQTFEQLAFARFLMGFIGAGFVVGIRLVGEWFPARQVGMAEGIYGGWGNFGSAGAAIILPTLAAVLGGENGWRYALIVMSVMSFIYAFIFYFSVRDTPKGATYFKPKKSGGLEVSSRKDFWALMLMNIPMYGALAMLTWKLSPAGTNIISQTATYPIYAFLFALYAFQTSQIFKVNKEMLKTGSVPEHQRYQFKQVAILSITYLITFGSELAIVSMLPSYFQEMFHLTPVKAGFVGASFAFMAITARPLGGWISDKFGRRKTMLGLLTGLAAGYLAMSQINSSWPLAAAVAITMACAFFVLGGAGAVFAMVPLIQRRMTGQIAGMAGAYGNVGGVIFLTIFSFVTPAHFFMIIAASSVLGLIVSCFLDEPKGHITEVMEDGSVQLIDVA